MVHMCVCLYVVLPVAAAVGVEYARPFKLEIWRDVDLAQMSN